MTDFIQQIIIYYQVLFESREFIDILLTFFPFVMIIEMPFYAMVFLGILRYYYTLNHTTPIRPPYYPKVSCVVTAYSEGERIKATLLTLIEQEYRGKIEILVAIDPCGNDDTVNAAKDFEKTYRNTYKNRRLLILNKATRGGHASSMNLGLAMATGEILINIDGDSSCDNDMVEMMVRHFLDEHVVGVSGTLRVSNTGDSLWTRFQALEYMFGIQLSRIGLSQLNMLNNISGAFGGFRKKFLKKIGGWNNGTAEDLDLTFRMHSYSRRFKSMRLISAPKSITYTDVPASLLDLLKQRLRWDGDLFYIYCRRHWRSFSPRFLGWKAFIGMLWYGLLFQIVIPLTIVCYLIYMFMYYAPAFVLAVLIFTYIYYFIILLIFYILHITLVSERKKADLLLFPFLVLMPIYQFFMRIFSAFSMIYEIIISGHKDTTMAPWWVIRKTK